MKFVFTVSTFFFAIHIIRGSAIEKNEKDHANGPDQPANLHTLILTQMFSNYGQRTAVFPYTGNPYPNYTYGVVGDPRGADGEGQLTPRGVRQMEELGKYVRHRYGNFIGPNYNPTELFAQSSNTEVSLASISTFLEAFYGVIPYRGKISGTTSTQDLKELNELHVWRPVPYHAISRAVDNFLAMTAACPAYETLYAEVQNLTIVQELNDGIDDFAAAAVQNGQPYESIKYMVMADLYNTIKVQKNFGLDLPTWVEKNFHSAQISGQFRLISEVYTPQLKRLRSGPLLTQIVQNFFVNIWAVRAEPQILLTPTEIDAYRKAKFYVYNVNDFSLIHPLYILGNFNGFVPDYPTAVFYELHLVNERRIVEIYFKAPNESVRKLLIPGCGPPCVLEDFLKLLENYMIDASTWTVECNATP